MTAKKIYCKSKLAFGVGINDADYVVAPRNKDGSLGLYRHACSTLCFTGGFN